MECVEAALKTSFRKEMTLKLSPQAVDEFCPVNLPNGVAFDEFFVDDLLDFSNDEEVVFEPPQEEPQQEKEKEEQQMKLALTLCPKQEQDNNMDESLNFGDLGPIPANELAVPADDVANLEWLSHFVEDSYSSPFPAGNLLAKANDKGAESERKPALGSPCFKTPIPAKARSKRTRTGIRVWSVGSPSLSSDSSSTSTASSSSSPSSLWLISTNPGSMSSIGPTEPFILMPPKKKFKKKSPPSERHKVRGSISWAQFARRCSHCGAQKTPQWRTGPLGAKTLCNACGVRYKSGRLFPEYRPACSPTFSSELHSNHHRKVLEMRQKKDVLDPTEPGLTPAVVSSF